MEDLSEDLSGDEMNSDASGCADDPMEWAEESDQEETPPTVPPPSPSSPPAPAPVLLVLPPPRPPRTRTRKRKRENRTRAELWADIENNFYKAPPKQILSRHGWGERPATMPFAAAMAVLGLDEHGHDLEKKKPNKR